MKTIGKITVGVGTKEQRQIDVLDILQSPKMPGERVVTSVQLIDGSFVFEISSNLNNVPSVQKIWLSEDSAIVFLTFATIFVGQKIGEDQMRIRLNNLLSVENMEDLVDLFTTKGFLEQLNRAI